MTLSRDAILKASDLKTQSVDVPEWGGSVLVKVMSGEQRQDFLERVAAPKGKTPKHMMEALLIACVVDDTGAPIFTQEDIPVLSKKSSVVLNRLFEIAADLNALTDRSINKISGE